MYNQGDDVEYQKILFANFYEVDNKFVEFPNE